MNKIYFTTNMMSSKELHESIIAKNLIQDDNIKFDIQDHPIPSRGALDPTALVALITGISAVATVLIQGLLKVFEKKAGKIVLQGKAGNKIEIPLGLSFNEAEEYIELAKKLDDIEYIHIIGRK